MTEPNGNALDLAETDALVEALKRRFSCIVIVGIRPDRIPAKGVLFTYTGTPAEAKGWSEYGSDLLTDEIRLAIADVEKGEDDE